MRFTSAATIALAFANSAISVETKDRKTNALASRNQRGRKALTNGQAFANAIKQSSGYAQTLQKKLNRKKQQELASGYRPLWSENGAGDVKSEDFGGKDEPDIGILSFNQNQQRPANVNPLWANESTEIVADQDGALPSFAECGPDVGILSCGDGFDCWNGVCVSTKRALQGVTTCPPSFVEPGFECDCTEFDATTGAGDISCVNPEGCLEDGTTCGYRVLFYSVTSPYSYIQSDTILNRQTGNRAGFGYTVADGSVAACIAFADGVNCACTLQDCSGSYNPFIECPGIDAIDICASNEDPLTALYSVTVEGATAYTIGLSCPPEEPDYPGAICGCDNFSNNTSLGSFTCTYEPVPGLTSGIKTLSYDVQTLDYLTYNASVELEEDSYDLTIVATDDSLSSCTSFVDGCECECTVGYCGEEPGVTTVACPGIDPLDSCGLPDNSAQFVLDLDPICSAEETMVPTTSPMGVSTTASPTSSPVGGSTTASPTATPISGIPTTAPIAGEPTTLQPSDESTSASFEKNHGLFPVAAFLCLLFHLVVG